MCNVSVQTITVSWSEPNKQYFILIDTYIHLDVLN